MEKLKDICKKLLENLKKNKFILLAFVVIWVVIAFLTFTNYKSSLGQKSFGNDYLTDTVIEVNENSTINETLQIEEDANSIALKFATYARKNSGHIYIKVTDKNTGAIYLDKSLNANDVLDNSFMAFSFNQKVDKDTLLEVNISSDSKEGEGVGIYYSIQVSFYKCKLLVNNEAFSGDLKMRFMTDNETLMIFNNKTLMWITIGMSLLVIVVALCSRKEIVFASIAFVAGLMFMTIITPMSPPDEQVHYEYCFQISNYIFGEEDHTLIDAEYQDYGDFAGHLNVSQAYESFEERLNEDLHLKDSYEIMRNDVDDATYTLCYIPQVLAIVLGRLLKLNMMRMFYTGRLFNLIFYSICVYIGIKKAPAYKTLYGIIAVNPVVLQQAASFSYDSFLNGLMLILVATFFSFYYREETISTKELVLFVILVLVLAPLKVVYSLFSLCFLFIPSEKFGGKKKKKIVMWIIGLFLIYQFYLMLAVSIASVFRNISEVLNFVQGDIKIAETLALDNKIILKGVYSSTDGFRIGYIVRNPGVVIAIIYRTVRYCIKIWFYEALGRVMSGMSILIPLKFSHIFSVIVVAAMLMKEKSHTTPIIRASFVLICIVIGMFIMLGMLLAWTSIDDIVIQGIQGRYFTTLLYFFLTIFNNKKIYLPQKIDKYLTYANLIMIFEVMIYIMSYTFIN